MTIKIAKEILEIDQEIEIFCGEMIKNFNKSAGKTGWKGKDKWWYLSQLAIAVRELETSMVKNSKDIAIKSSNVANVAMVISDLCKNEKPAKKENQKEKMI